MRRQGGSPNIELAAATVLAGCVLLAACDREVHGSFRHGGERTAEAATTSPQRAYGVAVEQAEGAHRVAIERCAVLAGPSQRTCRARADSDLARARADAARARDGGGTDTSM
jgi:hypothetical protein